MAQVFKNDYALDVGTSFVEIYECSGEVTYSVITGMTISNKKLNEVLVDVRIVDATNLVTSYLIINSKLSVGASLALAGDIQNIVLKNGDSIEVSCNEATALDVSLSLMENDPSIAYGGAGPAGIWYGDTAFVYDGESNGQYISEYTFSSNTMVTNIGTWSPLFGGSIGASNGTTCMSMGGYYSSASKKDIHTIQFADRAKSYYWAELYTNARLADSASNGIQALILGSYGTSGAITDIQKVLFEEGAVSTQFGDMTWGSHYYQGCLGNSTIAMALGYYSGSALIHYVEHASESNSTQWGGNMVYSAYGVTGAGNEEKALHQRGFSSSTSIYEQFFASQAASAYFDSLTYSMYEAGACSDGIVCWWAGSENANYAEKMDLYTGVNTVTPSTYYMDGGVPTAESGGGVA